MQQLFFALKEYLDISHTTGLPEISLNWKVPEFLSHLFPTLWHTNVLPVKLATPSCST